jgi:hypothetical protein
MQTVAYLLQLRQAEMGESIEFMEDFEQTEKLTDRLRSLLKDYDERSVLYEFIQNADDAGYVYKDKRSDRCRKSCFFCRMLQNKH